MAIGPWPDCKKFSSRFGVKKRISKRVTRDAMLSTPFRSQNTDIQLLEEYVVSWPLAICDKCPASSHKQARFCDKLSMGQEVATKIIGSPHPISLHWVLGKAVRPRGLEHRPKKSRILIFKRGWIVFGLRSLGILPSYWPIRFLN